MGTTNFNIKASGLHSNYLIGGLILSRLSSFRHQVLPPDEMAHVPNQNDTVMNSGATPVRIIEQLFISSAEHIESEITNYVPKEACFDVQMNSIQHTMPPETDDMNSTNACFNYVAMVHSTMRSFIYMMCLTLSQLILLG